MGLVEFSLVRFFLKRNEQILLTELPYYSFLLSHESTVVLCDQGGNRIDVYDNMTATLRSQAHHPPIIMESAGFCTEHSAKSRSIGYEKEVSPTLRAGTVPAAVFENHSADTRYTGPLEVSPTVSATYGTGGNNQPFVVESKAFAICSKESNAMKSDNPESGFYETDTARTIDTSNQSPIKNQGGIAIVENIKNYDVRITSEGTKNARQNVYETETSRTIDTGKKFSRLKSRRSCSCSIAGFYDRQKR